MGLDINGYNTDFNAFVKFAQNSLVTNDKTAVARFEVGGAPLCGRLIVAANPQFDKVGKFRNQTQKDLNNEIRIFDTMKPVHKQERNVRDFSPADTFTKLNIDGNFIDMDYLQGFEKFAFEGVSMGSDPMDTRDLYNKLMEMDKDPAKKEEFLNTLKPRISAAALKATENRLNEAIEHAKNLSLDGKVYDEAQWKDRGILGMMPDIDQQVTITKSDGKKVRVKPVGIPYVRDLLVRECPSIYKRDFLHLMFAKPQSA